MCENYPRLYFTKLLANSADYKSLIVFLFFPRKQDLTFHANCLQWKKQEKIIKMSAENFTEGANRILLFTVSRPYLCNRTSSFGRSVFRVAVSSHCTLMRHPVG